MGAGLFGAHNQLQWSDQAGSRPDAGLLHPDEYDQWLHGGLDNLIGFKERCFPDDLIVMERTTEPEDAAA